jgi:quercetin dioxygenase-like cupin family protein
MEVDNMSPKAQSLDKAVLAKLADAAELIQCQNDAVVSRTLIKKPSGTVTLFAFDAGQELSEHTAPFDAMVYVLEGKTQITISKKPLQLSAGQMVIMPAGKPHAVKAIEQFKMMLIMIREASA